MLTDNGWLLAPGTILVLVASLGRPLAEVRWPGGAIKWQNQAIDEIARVSYSELPEGVRIEMQEHQRQLRESGEGMGATSDSGVRLERALSPQEFARLAVEDVMRTHRSAEDFARIRGVEWK